MSKKIAVLLSGLIVYLPADLAWAASCWEVTGWSSTAYVGAQALLNAADCTTIPTSFGWGKVQHHYGTPPGDVVWLKISLTDSRVNNWRFQPLLVFSHYDGAGKPVVKTDLIPSTSVANEVWLLPYPPVQGTPSAGARVRLRHANTNKCAYTNGSHGGFTHNWSCWNDPGFVFVLDDAGSGSFRLRHESDSQCLYDLPTFGETVRHWGCWADPGMRYVFEAASGGYRLKHLSSGTCIYGNTAEGGTLASWGCWNDPNMRYFVDIINY